MISPIKKMDVIKAEKDWALAHRQLNMDQISKLMHPDYTIITPEGQVQGKEDALKSYSDKDRHWDYAESSDYTIRIYGITAIVIGVWRAKGVNNGTGFDYTARYTSMWVKEENELRIVSDQSTPLKDENQPHI